MTDPIATLYACDKLIERQRFVGLDQNPKGVRDLLYCAIRGAETEINRLRADLRRADDLADQAAKAIPLEFALSPSDGGGVDTHHAIKDMAAEIERLRADNARLSALVQRAYNEGFTEGMREHTSSRGGKPWVDSAARTAMEASSG